jgi:hypothetical protein
MGMDMRKYRISIFSPKGRTRQPQIIFGGKSPEKHKTINIWDSIAMRS